MTPLIADRDLFVDKKKPLVLLLTFMKENKLFYNLYKKGISKIFPKLSEPIPNYGYGNGSIAELWLIESRILINEINISDRLILSQLWRFFLLDNIDSIEFTSDEAKGLFVGRVKDLIKINGTHKDARLEDYFEKYSISEVKTTNIYAYDG